MTFLKSIYADLVEKRLWPVAVILLLALVAVPLLLGRGGGEPADVPTTAQLPNVTVRGADSPSAASERAEIGVETSPAPTTSRPGPAHDPFAGTRTSGSSRSTGTSAGTASAPTGASGGGSDASSGASGGGSAATASASSDSSDISGGSSASSASPASSAPSTATTPSASTTTPSTTTAPVPTVPASKRTLAVTLGVSPKAGARIDRRPGSLRLAPLPNAADPVVLFLGMLEHTPAAVFMLPDGATANGEGRCVPRPGDCQALELPVGGESYVDVPDASGATRELRLSVPGTKIASWSRVKQATTARERVSKSGLAIVRAAIDRHDPALSYYRFSQRTGLLVRHKQPPKG